MSPHSPLVRRTFRISVDIETTIKAVPDETSGSDREQVHFHQALVQQLLAHPQQLNHLLRSSAVDALKGAEKLLEGDDQEAEQSLLQPLIEALEPAAQAYFLEEIEDGVSVYSFDGYGATVKHVDMTELAEP